MAKSVIAKVILSGIPDLESARYRGRPGFAAVYRSDDADTGGGVQGLFTGDQ